MEIEVGEHAVVALERERIAAHEELLVAGESQHQIPGTGTREPGVGGDPHDGGVKVPPGFAVPARMKGRIQGQPVMRDSDGGDLMVVSGACGHSAAGSLFFF
jgi:hypothetical protein